MKKRRLIRRRKNKKKPSGIAAELVIRRNPKTGKITTELIETPEGRAARLAWEKKEKKEKKG